MAFEHLVKVNLLSDLIFGDTLERIARHAELNRETMSWSLDDAFYLVENGREGSYIKAWNPNFLNISDFERLQNSGLKKEYWNFPGITTHQIFLAKSLPKNVTVYNTRKLDDIHYLTIHHTVGWSFENSLEENAERIANYHVNSRKWPGIAYHYLIAPNGEIANTNPIEKKSYHAGSWDAPGDENLASIGIALGGDFRVAPPSKPQIAAASALVAELRSRLDNSIQVLPHKRMPGASTVCPGIKDLEKWLKTVSGEKSWI